MTKKRAAAGRRKAHNNENAALSPEKRPATVGLEALGATAQNVVKYQSSQAPAVSRPRSEAATESPV
jgi:hypothetical protein